MCPCILDLIVNSFLIKEAAMKRIITLSLGILTYLLLPTSVYAGDCVITVTRVACPGREEICYSKCNGKPTCDEAKQLDSKDACEKEAIKNCTVFRPGDTKSKKVVAKFDGAPLNGAKDYCDPVKPEFNYDLCG